MVARNALYNFLSRAWLTALALFCTPYIVHHLGEGAYGLLSLVSVVIVYFGMLDMGLAQGVLKYASEYYGRGDYDRLSRLIGTATTIYVGAGVVGAAAIALLVGALVTRVLNIGTDLRDVAYFAFYLSSLGFLVSMPLSVFNAIPAALQRMDITNQRTALIGTSNALGAVLLLRMGFWLREVVVLNIAASAIGVIAFVAVSRRLLPGVSFIPRYDRCEASRLFRYSLPTAASRVASRVAQQAPRLVVGMFWPLSHVTYFSIPNDICGRGMMLVSHVTTALFPAVSDRSGKGDIDGVRRMYLRSTRLVASIVMPLFVFLAVLSYPVLKAWMGDSIARHSGLVLSVMAAACWFQVLDGLQDSFLMAMGHPGSAAKWSIVQGVMTLALTLVLVPRFGALGAALALLIVYLGTVPPYVYVVSRRVLGLSLRSVLGCVPAPVVLSGACVIPVVLARESLTQLWVVALVLAAAGSLYAVTASWLGVLPKRDLALAWTALTRRQQRRSTECLTSSEAREG